MIVCHCDDENDPANVEKYIPKKTLQNTPNSNANE